MPRFYLPPESWLSPIWELPEEEARHASKVLRLKEGAACIVFDGIGNSSHATIQNISSPSHISLIPGERCDSGEKGSEITLCQAIPKGGNMDLIIQKSVELGVNRIIPLITERTIVRLTNKEGLSKQEKWQRTVLEACKQCGRNQLPKVELPQKFDTWIRQGFPSQLPLIASLADGALPIRDILEKARSEERKEVMLLVGPEGDFTPEETRLALDSHFIPVTLGNIVLRVETACFFGISSIRYALD